MLDISAVENLVLESEMCSTCSISLDLSCGCCCSDRLDDQFRILVNELENLSFSLPSSVFISEENTIKLKSIIPEYRKIILWLHAFLGHIDFETVINNFRKGDFDSLPEIVEKYSAAEIRVMHIIAEQISYRNFTCITCQMEKISAQRSQHESQPPPVDRQPMSNGHIDIYGPLPVGVRGERYVMFYICDDSTFGFVDFTEGRDFEKDIKPVITKWRLETRDAGWEMKVLHCDADPIFKSKQFQDFVKSHGINTYYAPPGQHWRNGLVERFIRTISSNAKTMLSASGLPFKYWFFAIKHAVLLSNLVCQRRRTRKNPSYSQMSAYEVFTKAQWKLRMPIFGQLVISRNSDPARLSTADTRGRECVFLGFDFSSHNSYVLLHKKSKHIIVSRDVQIIPNVYGWTGLPVVADDNLRVIGRIARESQSATDDQLDKLENIQPLRQTNGSAAGVQPPSIDLPINPFDSAEQISSSLNLPVMDNAAVGPNQPQLSSDSRITNRLRRSQLMPKDSLQGIAPGDIYIQCISVLQNYFNDLDCNSLNSDIGRDNKEVIWNVNQSCYISNFQYERILTLDESRQIVHDSEKSLDVSEILINAVSTKKMKIRSKLVNNTMENIPRNIKEALSDEYISRYESAIKAEVQDILSHNVYQLPPVLASDLPAGVKPCGTTWVFDIKTQKDSTLIRYKARNCVQGFTQQYMVHYFQTYSPTMMRESLRIFIYLIAVCNWHQHIFDVKVAFLHGRMDADVWIEYPQGFPGWSAESKQYVKLLMAQYGTKQAMRMFANHRDTILVQIGYKQLISDECIWMRVCNKGLVSFIGTHVDDFPLVSQDPQESTRVATSLSEYWELSQRTVMDFVLGVKTATYDNSTVLYNDTYFLEVAAELKLGNVKPIIHLGNPKFRFMPNTTGKVSPDMHHVYLSLIGSLMWAALSWRPDINYFVGQLARFSSNPSMEHLDAAIDILRYCLATPKKGLCYQKSQYCPDVIPQNLKIELLAWSDADWAKDSDSVSASGAVISLHFPEEITLALKEGRSESWNRFTKFNCYYYHAIKQSGFIAISSESSETRAALDIGKVILHARNLLKEMNLLYTERPTYLLMDNTATIVNLNEGKISRKTKHDALAHNFVRQLVKDKEIQPWKLDSKDNRSDIFTKILAANNGFNIHRDNLMADAQTIESDSISTHSPKRQRLDSTI